MPAQEKVLIVDDSSSVRRTLKVMLSDGGYEVVTATNGVEGLAAARSTRVDLIIADVNMPLMNGIEMIGEIRKLDDYQHTPIFVLTSESTAEVVQEAKMRGANAFIIKPFRPDLLMKGVERLLERSSQRRALG